MFVDQVIRWTQRKRFSENLGGGGLEVIGQGGSDSDQPNIGVAKDADIPASRGPKNTGLEMIKICVHPLRVSEIALYRSSVQEFDLAQLAVCLVCETLKVVWFCAST